jgi:uncharacterized protein (DUF1697 family)
MRYVALLRGINVGGKSTVSMSRLKSSFEELGLDNVKTYINSGNVLFETRASDRKRLVRKIETAIEKQFKLPVRVTLRTPQEIARVVKAVPKAWATDKKMRCDVMFLWPEVDKRAVLKQVPTQPKIEDLKYTKGALIWRIDRKNAGKSRVGRMIGSDLYKSLSIRNINTVRKLDELLRA